MVSQLKRAIHYLIKLGTPRFKLSCSLPSTPSSLYYKITSPVPDPQLKMYLGKREDGKTKTKFLAIMLTAGSRPLGIQKKPRDRGLILRRTLRAHPCVCRCSCVPQETQRQEVVPIASAKTRGGACSSARGRKWQPSATGHFLR